MTEWIAAIFLLLGSFFMFVAALGVLRLPDLYMRLHASSKGTSLGLLFILTAVALYFAEFWVVFEAILVIFFTFLTSPVASHMIGRAAYFMHVHMWEGTVVDELQGQYHFKSKTLAGQSPELKENTSEKE